MSLFFFQTPEACLTRQMPSCRPLTICVLLFFPSLQFVTQFFSLFSPCVIFRLQDRLIRRCGWRKQAQLQLQLLASLKKRCTNWQTDWIHQHSTTCEYMQGVFHHYCLGCKCKSGCLCDCLLLKSIIWSSRTRQRSLSSSHSGSQASGWDQGGRRMLDVSRCLLKL